MTKRVISLLALLAFLLNSVLGPNLALSQPLSLPQPGDMVTTSPAFIPVLLKGLKVHPDNALLFDFIIDSGKSGFALNSPDFKSESEKLIKYFLAALTIKEEDLWVNLSPYEKDRMVTDELGKTELGRDMLEQDYLLKQLTASLIYPEKELGKAFWNKVYAEAFTRFGTTDIPIDTFNKVWITADKAKVLERNGTAYIVGAHLKVMLESDYLAAEKSEVKSQKSDPDVRHLTSDQQGFAKQVVREVILPALESEVNSGANFALLRQMFYSMILASWYKLSLKDAFLNQVFSNKAKTGGVEADDPQVKEQIYAQYLTAYKKGVFNYIKEESDVSTGETVPRKYFSGGLRLLPADPAGLIERAGTLAPDDDAMKVGDMAMVTANIAQAGRDAAMGKDRSFKGRDFEINAQGILKGNGSFFTSGFLEREKKLSAQHPTIAIDLDGTILDWSDDDNVAPYEGVEDELKKLLAAGYRLVLWTASSEEEVRERFTERFSDLAGLFDLIIPQEAWAIANMDDLEQAVQAYHGTVSEGEIIPMANMVKDIRLPGYALIVDDGVVQPGTGEKIEESGKQFGFYRVWNSQSLGGFLYYRFFNLRISSLANDILRVLGKAGDRPTTSGDKAMAAAGIAEAQSVITPALRGVVSSLNRIVDGMAGQPRVSGTEDFLNNIQRRLSEEKIAYLEVYPVTHWGYITRNIPVVSSWGDLPLEKVQEMVQRGLAQAVILKLQSGQQIYLVIDNVRPVVDRKGPVTNTAYDAAMGGSFYLLNGRLVAANRAEEIWAVLNTLPAPHLASLLNAVNTGTTPPTEPAMRLRLVTNGHMDFDAMAVIRATVEIVRDNGVPGGRLLRPLRLSVTLPELLRAKNQGVEVSVGDGVIVEPSEVQRVIQEQAAEKALFTPNLSSQDYAYDAAMGAGAITRLRAWQKLANLEQKLDFLGKRRPALSARLGSFLSDYRRFEKERASLLMTLDHLPATARQTLETWFGLFREFKDNSLFADVNIFAAFHEYISWYRLQTGHLLVQAAMEHGELFTDADLTRENPAYGITAQMARDALIVETLINDIYGRVGPPSDAAMLDERETYRFQGLAENLEELVPQRDKELTKRAVAKFIAEKRVRIQSARPVEDVKTITPTDTIISPLGLVTVAEALGLVEQRHSTFVALNFYDRPSPVYLLLRTADTIQRDERISQAIAPLDGKISGLADREVADQIARLLTERGTDVHATLISRTMDKLVANVPVISSLGPIAQADAKALIANGQARNWGIIIASGEYLNVLVFNRDFKTIDAAMLDVLRNQLDQAAGLLGTYKDLLPGDQRKVNDVLSYKNLSLGGRWIEVANNGSTRTLIVPDMLRHLYQLTRYRLEHSGIGFESATALHNAVMSALPRAIDTMRLGMDFRIIPGQNGAQESLRIMPGEKLIADYSKFSSESLVIRAADDDPEAVRAFLSTEDPEAVWLIYPAVERVEQVYREGRQKYWESKAKARLQAAIKVDSDRVDAILSVFPLSEDQQNALRGQKEKKQRVLKAEFAVRQAGEAFINGVTFPEQNLRHRSVGDGLKALLPVLDDIRTGRQLRISYQAPQQIDFEFSQDWMFNVSFRGWNTHGAEDLSISAGKVGMPVSTSRDNSMAADRSGIVNVDALRLSDEFGYENWYRKYSFGTVCDLIVFQKNETGKAMVAALRLVDPDLIRQYGRSVFRKVYEDGAPDDWRQIIHDINADYTDSAMAGADALHEKVILSINDTQVQQYLVDRILSLEGAKVISAASGAEAMNLLRGTKVDAVVTDLNMPGMDGTEVVKQMKASFPDVPVVMFTSATADSVPGLEKILRIPVVTGSDFDKLKEALAGVLADKAMAAEDVMRNRTVLVVDDSPTIRRGLMRMLKGYGVKVIEAADGQEALDIIKARPGEVDALLTDNNMPRMTGRELTKAVHSELPGFPVVMLSGEDDDVLAQIQKELNIPVLGKPAQDDVMLQALADVISPQGNDSAMTPGGIDLNGKKLEMDVSREGAGVAMSLDPALMEEFRRGDFSGVIPVILKITPVSGPAAILGLSQEPLPGSAV